MRISEEKVKQKVKEFLSKKGWEVKITKSREHGVDIKAKHLGSRGARKYFIEAKGDPNEETKNKGPSIESKFVYAMGQIMSRMRYEAKNYRYGLAFPSSFRKRFKLRGKKGYRLPRNLMKKLKLDIFIVSKKGVKKYTYSNYDKIYKDKD